MKPAKVKSLKLKGWQIGDAADFLNLSESERQLLDARVTLSLAVRRQREKQQLSQKQLGERLQTSQPRVARIESGASDVSLDQLFRAFAAAGGKITVKASSKRLRKNARASSGTGESVVVDLD